jgi:hypothetical protein
MESKFNKIIQIISTVLMFVAIILMAFMVWDMFTDKTEDEYLGLRERELDLRERELDLFEETSRKTFTITIPQEKPAGKTVELPIEKPEKPQKDGKKDTSKAPDA